MKTQIASIVVAGLLYLSVGLAAQEESVAPTTEGALGSTIVVEITDTGFRPLTVTARRGDVVRFLQHSGMAHNVEFVRTPEEAQIGPERVPIAVDPAGPTALPPLRIGPYLMAVGEVYEVWIDEFLPEGVYEYRCSSHDYRGLIVVLDDVEF